MRAHLGVPALICGLVVALSSCSDPESSDTSTASSTSSAELTTASTSATPTTTTSTMTVTETETASPTETAEAPEPSETLTEPVAEDEDLDDSDTADSEGASSDIDAEEDTAEPEPEETEESDFDAAWAKTCAGRVVRDMKTVDGRLRDGGAVGSGLSLLSDSFDCFEDAGVPPGSDAATYTARVRTLSKFSSDAADLYDANATTASAKYAVVKENTGPLFSTVNAATGSDYAVP